MYSDYLHSTSPIKKWISHARLNMAAACALVLLATRALSQTVQVPSIATDSSGVITVGANGFVLAPFGNAPTVDVGQRLVDLLERADGMGSVVAAQGNRITQNEKVIIAKGKLIDAVVAAQADGE